MKNAIKACGFEFREQPRTQMMRAMVLVGILILVDTIVGLTSLDGKLSDYAGGDTSIDISGACTSFVNVLLGTNMFMFTVALQISASMMFGQLRNKTSRISFLMTPIGTTEKLVGQVLFYIVGFSVLYFVAMFFSTIVATLIVSIVNGVNILFHINPSTLAFKGSEFSVFFNFMGLKTASIVSVIAMATFYMVGSLFFVRFTFIKTMLALYVSTTILSICLIPFLSVLPAVAISSSGITVCQWIMVGYFVSLILFNGYIALRKLRETDII